MADSPSLALHSVMFHSRFRDPGTAPAGVRPLPLAEAVRLLADAAAGEPLKRWWALSHMLASPFRDTAGLSNPINRAIVDLAPVLEPALPAAPPAPLHPLGVNDAIRIDHGPNFAFLERYLGALQATCQTTAPCSEVHFDTNSQITHGKATVKVRRPLADVARTMDPQNWTTFYPEYFRASCVTDCSGGCVPDANYDLACLANPPALASPWQEALFESYTYEAGPLWTIAFKNVLDVTSSPGQGKHRYDYALDHILLGRIGVAQKVGAGIDVDGGYLEMAEGQGRWVELTVTKDFRLADWDWQLGPGSTYYLNAASQLSVLRTVEASWDVVCNVV
jgi:hypothetical protein